MCGRSDLNDETWGLNLIGRKEGCLQEQMVWSVGWTAHKFQSLEVHVKESELGRQEVEIPEGTVKMEADDVRDSTPDINDKYVFDVGGSPYHLEWGS